MRTQLLCTFTKRNRLYETVGLIIECHDIVFNKVYVFQNEDDHHSLMCTYNIPFTNNYWILFNPSSFPVPWEEYQNQLLLVNDDGLNKIRTRIYTIVNIDTWENDQKLKNEL